MTNLKSLWHATAKEGKKKPPLFPTRKMSGDRRDCDEENNRQVFYCFAYNFLAFWLCDRK